MNYTYSMSPPQIDPDFDASPNDERVKILEENYQRQSRTLRLSQLNTAPAKKEEAKFESPKAFELGQPEDLEDVVASKNILLMRCKGNIEELQAAVNKEKEEKERWMRESEQQKEMIEEMKRKLAEKEEEIEEMKRAKEVDADNYNETISRLEAANKKFKIALNDKKTQHEFDMARSVLEIDEERNRLVEKNNKVIAELKEKDDKIQELLNVIDELESKTTSYETEREEVAYSLNEANKALSMKTKTITELQRSISDLQMVNQKLKDLATARAEEIESMKLSIIETEAELKKSIKETEEQLEMKYMEREREMKQDMKNTIAQFKASVENMAKDSEKYKAESALLRKQLLQAETAYKDQKAETAKSEALVSGLRNEIFMLENEINRVKAELKDKEENWRFDKEKIEAETKTREQEWKNVIETYENEMKQVKAKYMDLELEFQNTKQELEDANLGLQKSEDVIYNYKSLIESLRGSKDRVVTELETSETRIHELSRAVEVEKEKGRKMERDFIQYKAQIEEERQRLVQAKESLLLELNKVKTKHKKERELRESANSTLSQLNEKVKDIEERYGKELTHYKQAYQRVEEEHSKTRSKYEKALKNANAGKMELIRGIEKIETEARSIGSTGENAQKEIARIIHISERLLNNGLQILSAR